MAKKNDPYYLIIKALEDLKRGYPHYTMGQHFSTALSDYGDVWGITDKEFLFAIQKYKTEQEFNIAPDKSVEEIIEESQDLYRLLDEEKEEGEESAY